MDITGKNVIVTGGFGSLGRKTAAVLAEAGARVALIDRVDAPADIRKATGAAVAIGNVDLTDPASAATAVDKAAAELGGLDGLVNIAGAFRWETFEGGEIATWDMLYEANLKTAVCACKAALPHLVQSKAGRIVNIGAGAAAKAAMGMGAYAASKAGVARLTEALAEEQKTKAITVNALLPSIIDTPANRKDMPDADFRKWVTPGEIADVVQFLLSDKARGITGALIAVPGRV